MARQLSQINVNKIGGIINRTTAAAAAAARGRGATGPGRGQANRLICRLIYRDGADGQAQYSQVRDRQ